MDRLKLVLEGTERRRMAHGHVVIASKAGDVTLAHAIDDALDVARAHSDVVGRRRGAVLRDRYRRGGRAARGGCAQLAGIELEEGFNIEALASVVLEALVDDLENVVLGQGSKFAGVGTPC